MFKNVACFICIGQGLITWAMGQQPNLVKALRQENSGGHRDWSGQMLSSSSPMYVLIILKDCGDKVGEGNNFTAGTRLKFIKALLSIWSWKQLMCVILTLESLGWSAEALSTQGTDPVAFTQLDVAVTQIVPPGQQCMWSPQHSAYEDSSSRNTLTTKVLKLLSHWLNEAWAFIWLIK